jgi:hypothetical protein
VGHADLKAQRGHFGFPNKYDDNDALCLAASYFDPQWIDEFGKRRFLDGHLIKEIWPLRELVLEYYQLDKLLNAVTNQLQQRLSYEFPELAALSWQASGKGYIEAIAWLAGKQAKRMRDHQYDHSVAKRLGINFSSYTKEHAALHHSLELRKLEIESKLMKVLENPLFTPYLKALEPFQFGIGLKGLILYKVFPFEKFLVNGFPHIERYLSRSNQWQKRNVSLQHFQAYFGLSRRVEQSGGKEKIKWSGSKLLRSKFYVWVLTRVCSKAKARLRNDLGEYLGAKWDDMKDNDKASGKDAITRVSFMATRILFQRLRDEIVF